MSEAIEPTAPATRLRLHAGQAFRDEPWAPEMIVIPAGSFLMGSPTSEPNRWDDEGPRHSVKIGRPFAMSRCAVTFDDYDCFAQDAGRALPADQGWGRGRRPVINVSWFAAQDYVVWLNKKLGVTGLGATYRLPTESEWEYAARAGTSSAYWWGPAADPLRANYDGCARSAQPTDEDFAETVPVDTYERNPWGLNMLGNVGEWVQDPCHGSYKGAPKNASCWAQYGDHTLRVIRGGCWSGGFQTLRCASRSWCDPTIACDETGFRLARDFR